VRDIDARGHRKPLPDLHHNAELRLALIAGKREELERPWNM
jgi:hypothetical protein